MALRIACANIGFMSGVRTRHEQQLAERAEALRAAEAYTEIARLQLHEAIRSAGDPALPAEDKMGPSAIARATGHKYTREYITELLKKAYG